jgi:hypothetical protein
MPQHTEIQRFKHISAKYGISILKIALMMHIEGWLYVNLHYDL